MMKKQTNSSRVASEWRRKESGEKCQRLVASRGKNLCSMVFRRVTGNGQVSRVRCPKPIGQER